MAQVVQAKCPFCKQVLRIPGDWLGRPMRCKHCRQTFQAKAAQSPAPVPVARPAAQAINNAASPVAIPVAAIAAKSSSGLPVAKPLGAPVRVSDNPFSFEESQTAPAGVFERGPAAATRTRPSRGGNGKGWLKGALVGACVLGTAGLVMAIFGEDILSRVAAPTNTSKNDANAERKRARDKKAPSKDKPSDKKSARDKAARDVARPGDGKSNDAGKPGDGSKPKDASKPGDEAKPNDGVKPKDGTKPKDIASPRDDTKPKDGAKPADGARPIKDGTAPKDPPKDGTRPKEIVKPVKPKGPEEFPRRALLISVNNYLYANPLSYGTKGNSTGDLAEDLNRYLHIPRTQVAELSDGARVGTAYPPIKPVIQQTIADFLAGARPMDRVLLLFTGHAVDLEKAIYLVPMEGDLDKKETLVPLSLVLDSLVKCPAREKVLILDVFRLDPSRGQERRGAGEMSATFDAALKKIPGDIEVWTSCSAKEQSYEFDGGSLFLEAFCNVLRQKGIKGIQQPVDPLPMSILHAKVSDYIVSAVKDVKLKQTPQLLGKDPDKGAPYNPDTDLPPPLSIKPPPQLKDGIAPKDEIQGILDEIEALPPAKGGGALGSGRLRYESMPPFPAKGMAKYKVAYTSLEDLDKKIVASPKEMALIKAVRHASKVLKEYSEAYKETFDGKGLPIPAPVKTQVIKLQEKAIGKPLFELQEALDEMKKVEDTREEEKSKRWQAHFDYVKAKLLARIIYLREYSLMMGKIRKDELPTLSPGNTGWRLASRSKLQSTDKEIKDMLSDYKKSLASLEKKHKDTPWEILARREKGTFLGLEWKPNGRTANN